MKTRLILAALALALAGMLSFAIDSAAEQASTPEPGHVWCFTYPYYSVQGVTCVELPVPPIR